MKKTATIYKIIAIAFLQAIAFIDVVGQNTCLKIGQNVSTMEFKDIFKQNNGWRFPDRSPAAVCSGVFGAPNCPEQPFINALPKDINGYVTGGIPYAVTNIQTTIYNTYTGTITAITTYMQRETYQPYPLGDYYVFWQGQGTMRFFWNDGPGMINITAGSYGTIPVANGYELNFGVVNNGITAINVNSVTSDNSAGVHYCRITVPATTGNPARDPYNNPYGIGMQITSSAVAPNHLRGISVVTPDISTNAGGYSGGNKSIVDGAAARAFVNSGPEHFKNQPFHPAYLNWLRGFPTLRFMGLLGINNENPTDVSWLNVRSYDYFSQTAVLPNVGHPVNYMYIIQLCNILKANPWINGYVNSDENYQRNLGKLFSDNLDPSLKVYLEMSNENTWNFAFGFNGPPLINAFLAANPGIPGPGENTLIAAAAFLENRLWQNFGSSWNGEDQDRIVRVCAGQSVNPYQAQQKALYHENRNERYDVLSLAWYLDQLQTNARAIPQVGTPLQLINAMIADNNYNYLQDSYTNFPSIAKQLKAHAVLARSKGKKIVLYEGGTHHSYSQDGRENWDRSKFIKWLPEARLFYRSLIDTIRNYPEVELALNFMDYGGNSTLSNGSTVGEQSFGVVPTMYSDTTASGNRSYTGLEFGSIDILGTNAHGVWKELQAQNNIWRFNSICNPTVTSDIVGSGLTLSFSSIKSQYVNVSSATLFDPLSTPSYTIEAWINPTELERQQTIWAYSNGTNILNALYISSLNRIQWNLGNGATVLNGPLVERNKWYHVSLVKNGTSVLMYVNGTMVSSGSASGSAGIPTNFTLGASNAGSLANFLRGQIDELKVWSSAALSQTQVRDFMCKKVTPSHPNYAALSTYIEFNSISGTNLMDKKTGVTHGSLVNFVSTDSYSYVQSGAPIGDLSTNIYPANWTGTSLSFTNPLGGDIINVNSLGSGSPDGVHIYVVNQAPTLNTRPQFYQTIAGKYFGVFVANGTNPSYNVNYNYQGNPTASATTGFNRLVKRDAGSDYSWDNSGARIDALNRTLITNCTENYRSEYILGVRTNQLIQRPGAGACISLSGSAIGIFNNFNRPDVYTIAFWAKGGNGMLGFRNTFSGDEIGYYPTSRNGYVARYNDISLGNQNQIEGGGSVVWSHYAYTRDASGRLTYYVNGYPSSSVSFPGDTSMVDMFIGYAKNSSNYTGQIDELSVWKRDLSQTEIRDIMCKKITPAHPSYCELHSYFRFDEASGNVLENTLGAGNIVFNGTIGWERSGAALGDDSKHNYNTPFVSSIAHPNGDFIRVTPASNNPLVGSHSYVVFGNPNYPIYPSTETYPVAIPNRDTSRYFGTFVIPYQTNDGGNTRSYVYEYFYGSNSNINFLNEASLRLIRRENNFILNWTDTGANLNTAARSITFNSPVRTDDHYPVGEFLLAGVNPSPFIPIPNVLPTVAGITGKSTLCLGESNALYRVLATVDRNALSFRWIATNGLSLSNSTSDTVLVTALQTGTQYITVLGVNRLGVSTPPTVYTVNVQNTGAQSANILGAFNVCNSTSSVYSIAGVSPAPLAYIWSLTGDALYPTPTNTPSATFNFGNAGQSVVRIAVFGQYSCGLSLINTINVNNNSLPTTNLAVLGDSICSIDGLQTISVKVLSSQNGVTYTAFDGVTPVATSSGNGGIMNLVISTGILTPTVNKVITIRAQNNLCPLVPVSLASSANILMGNTLTGAQLAPIFANPSAICSNLNTGSIRDFPLVITSGAVAGVTYTPNYLTFAQPYGESFEYQMGPGAMASGSSVSMIVQPGGFPYWLSFGVPNTLSGLAQAPGCPTQRLTTRTTFTLNNTPDVAVPSKVAGTGKGLRAPGDNDYPVCTGTPTSYYTTSKGGSITQFNQRYFSGAMTNGNQNITMSAYSNMLATQIAVNDVVYILGNQTDGNGLPATNNLPQSDGNGNRIPYFVVAVDSGANTVQLSTTRGGGAITPNFTASNIRFWAPITIDIPDGTNTFTIPERFGTLNLSMYSQINFNYASQSPGGVCIGSSGGECHGTQYVASINGNSFQLTSNQLHNGGVNSAGYFINRGRITYNTGSNIVSGFGTAFQTEQLADAGDGRGGAILRDINNNFIGEVNTVSTQGNLILKANAAISGTSQVFSSHKRIYFTSEGQSVVLSAPQDAEPTGFEWTVGPREAIVAVTGATGGGGIYNPTTGVFSGNNSDAFKNGITITWNGTFSGQASVAVTSSKLTPCFAKSNPQYLPNTPGYEQTNITLKMQSQIPSIPTAISFTELEFCQSQSRTNFATNSSNASGGLQWQLQNAGTSTLRYFYGGGPCQWSQTSNNVGDKGVDNNPFQENTGSCLNSSVLENAPHLNNNSIGVDWQPGFTGLATIRVRSLGCGSMSNAGDMRASAWVSSVITVGGAPNPSNINLSGQLQLCQGISPTQQYIASGTNIDQFRYFLRRPVQSGDIDPGLVAYYTFDGNYNNTATGVWSLGSAVNGTPNSTTLASNKNSVANRAVSFNNDQDWVALGTDNRLNLTNSFSVSAWVNVTSGNGTYSLYSRGGGYQEALQLLINVNGSNGRLGVFGNSGNFGVEDYGGNNGSFIGSNFPITGWKHISFTGNFAGGTLVLTGYVDGVLLGTVNVAYEIPYLGNPSAETRIGGFETFKVFNGSVDEVMIHNRQLSPQDVQAIYALNANAFVDPSDYIGEINGNTGLATWQTTFTGPAQIGVQAIGCGGSSIKLYDAFISPKPSILGVSISDPTDCGNPLASGSVTITLASFNPSTFTGSPWAVSWNNDLISDGIATLSGNNSVTLSTGLFAGSSVTGISTWYNGSLGCNAPISITSRIIQGSSPPSSLIGTSLMSGNQVCTGSTSSGINVLGSQSSIQYYAMIGSMVVSPTVVGTGGNIQLSITGTNILTATGSNQVYQIKTIAVSVGCPIVTLAGIQNITVNGLSAVTGAVVTGTNPICNPATSVVSIGGVNGTIDWQVSTGGAFSSTGGTVANYTTTSLTQTSTFRALVTNGACPTVTTSSAVVTVNSPVTTTFAYNQLAYCNNVTTSVSPILSVTTLAGAFSVAPAGLTLNSSTGLVTVNSSTANIYTVTYSYTVPGCPALTTTTSVRIGSIPGLAFGFNPTVFCTSSGNQTPGTTFTGLGAGGTFSSTSAGLVFANAATGQVNVLGSSVGTYPLIYTVSVTGCGNVTSTVGNAITINSVTGATISYSGSPYCNNAATANVVATNTVTGGIYTSAPAGLTINATNGMITPSSSVQGNYTVSYSYTIPGCGAQVAITTVGINSVPGILFSYASPFCKNGTNPTPSTTIGGTGGVFSSAPAGLSFANATNGTVDLTASTAGTYNLTYTLSIPGCGNVTSTVGNAITINSVPGVSISYVSPVCNTATILGVTAINTVSGGSYSATGGLSINATNGTVNPSGFGGTYTITYSYTVAGCGLQSTTTSLVVTTLPSIPILGYGASPYCSSSSPINIVSATNAINGSYLSTATGFTVNAINGQITIPQNTLAGVFVVRYDIPAGGGCASVTGNNTITLSGVPNALTVNGVGTPQCYNSNVVLTATGTIAGSTIQWLQDGVAVGTNSAVYTATGLTNTSYSYVAVLNNGVCTTVASAPKVININQNPTITGISASQSFACSSQSVSLSNTGLVGTIAYAVNTGAGFNLIGGTSYTFSNTIVGNSFSFVGYAFVAGCQTVTSPIIIVNSSVCGLTAAYSPSLTQQCLNNATSTGIIFTNTSTSAGGTITGYVWNFGAGATPASTVVGINSTNYTIPVTYSTSGLKTITLSIIGTGALTSTITGTVTIDALSTISGITLPVPICETNNTVNLSVTALGNIQWYKSGVAQGTSAIQAAGAMTSNTTFIATAVNGVCPMVTSTGVVTITNLNVGGNITGAAAICASSSGLNLTLNAQVGNSYTWYSSTNNGTTWNTLSSNTSPIATGTLSTTTSFVVSVSGGVCPNVASPVVTINVTQTPIAGTANVDRMIVCTSDGNGGIYSLVGQSGTIQWERSTDNITFANASGAGSTTSSFTANTETVGNRYFRARVTNGGSCGDVFSNVITITGSTCDLQAAFTPNNTTVCVSVGNTVVFTDASTSANTILGYTWDFAGGTGGNINSAGPHTITYSVAGQKNIRLTISGLGGLTSIATGTVQVDETSAAGTISTGLASPICYNTGATLTLTGNVGSTIQWYSTTSGILGSTTSTLGTGSLTTGDGYFTTVRNGVCPMVTTSGVSVSVHPQSNAGTITASAASVCQNLTASLSVAGQTGSIYQWQEWNGSAFVNIANATTSGYTTSALTNTVSGTYQYRLEVKSGISACTPDYSNTVTVDAIVCSIAANITVNGTLLPTAISLQDATGTGLNFGIQLISGTVIGYNWLLTGAGTNISISANVNTGYASPNVYNVLVTVIGVGNVQFPYATVITIDGMSQPGTVLGNGTPANPICYNTSDLLTLSGFVGNAIQWYNSSGIITGSTSATYNTPNLIANETYFATVRNGVSPMVTTAGFTVNVNSEATATGVNIPSVLCIGTSATITATGINGTVTGWESSPDGFAWSSVVGSGNTYTIASLTDPIVYYRPLVTNGLGCTPVSGNSSIAIDAIGCSATVSFTGLPANLCSDNATIPANTIIDATQSAAPILAWFWDFGSDATPATANSQSTPAVSYSTSGTKTITLAVTIAGGNSFNSITTVGLTRTINIDQKPTASFSYANSSYCENFGSVGVSASVVTSGGTFFANGLTFSNASTGDFSTNAQTIGGPYTIRYAIPATLGCAAQTIGGAAMTIRANPIVNEPQYTNGNIYCNVGSTGNATSSNSTGLYVSSPNIVFVDATNGNINLASLAIGSYNISYSISGTNTCSAVQSSINTITVNQNPSNATFSYAPTAICSDGSALATVSPVGGRFVGSTDLTINQSNGNVFASSSLPIGTNPYTISYILTAIGFGCIPSTTTSNIITISKQPIIPNNFSYVTSKYGTSGQLCVEQGLATVDVSGNLTGGAFSISPSITGYSLPSDGSIDLSRLNIGKYSISYTVPPIAVNGNNVCLAVSSTAIINTTSSGKADITAPNSGACQGQSVGFALNTALFKDSESIIVWSEKIATGQVNTLAGRTELVAHTLLGSGLHIFTASIKNGQCATVLDSVLVNVDEYPIAGVASTVDPQDILLCYIPDAQLTITGFRGTDFIWEYYKKQVAKDKTFEYIPTNGIYQEFLAYDRKVSGANSPSFIKDDDYTSEFYIRAKVTNGFCKLDANGKDVFTPVLTIKKCEIDVFIPNALTPGTSDINSFWDIQKLRLPESVKVTIFNRYGVEVHAMTGKDLQNPALAFNGEGLPAGTYYYVIDFNGLARNIQGDITIVR